MEELVVAEPGPRIAEPERSRTGHQRSPKRGACREAGASRLKTLLLVVAVTLLNAFGNLSLAWGMKHAAVHVGLAPAGYVRDMLNPFVALGISMLILWLLTRMALLSWADLSFVLPVTAVGYFLAAVLGRLFLREAIRPGQWIGTLLIFIGIAIVGTTSHKTRMRREVQQ